MTHQLTENLNLKERCTKEILTSLSPLQSSDKKEPKFMEKVTTTSSPSTLQTRPSTQSPLSMGTQPRLGRRIFRSTCHGREQCLKKSNDIGYLSWHIFNNSKTDDD